MNVNRTSPLRVLVVDADPGSRTGLVSLLGDSDEVEVIGEAGSVPRATELTRQLGPDIVLLNAPPTEVKATGVQADALSRMARVMVLTGASGPVDLGEPSPDTAAWARLETPLARAVLRGRAGSEIATTT